MRSFAEELEADLLREYQVDVLDWWRGRLSSRRLVVLARNLSDESAMKRAMSGDPWTLHTHLLVGVNNELRMARADFATVHGEKRVTPKLIPRPGEVSAQERREESRRRHLALLATIRGDADNTHTMDGRDVAPPIIETG